MTTTQFAKLTVSLFLLSSPSLLSSGEPPRRIKEDLRNHRTFVLSGSVSPHIAIAQDQGELTPVEPLGLLTMHFRPSAAQQNELDAFLKRQRDRHSPDYHKWLTPEQFGARFGMAEEDLQRVRQWLQSNGFTITQTARSKTWIAFSGIAANVQNAFGTPLHRYSFQGADHFANQRQLNLPAALNGVVSSIYGLDDFRPRPSLLPSRVQPLQPLFTSNISGSHFLAPDDFATIYNLKPLFNSGINGLGQTIAIAGQTDVDLTDIRAFRTAAGLPASDPQIVLYGTDPGTSKNDLPEADLDIEWAGAAAPQATIVYVNSQNAFLSALYAIDQNLAQVVSLSYSSCEANLSAPSINSLANLFQQGNAQGITTIAASGDNGAADCDAATSSTDPPVTSATRGLQVGIPSSIPSVTGVGGTTFQEGTGTYWSTTNTATGGSALSYIPEVAWNDTVPGGSFSASGGGRSTAYTKPVWQVGSHVPDDGRRDTPDLALAASPSHDGYLICTGGTCVNGFRSADNSLYIVGGASVASPTLAGIVALLNQQTKTKQGNINPGLYSLASLSTTAFHDITQGNNMVPCTAGTTDCPNGGSIGYSAGPGYDQVTGLGSVDAYNLVTQWGTDFDVTISPSTLTLNVGRSSTATVQVSKVINFAGIVSFTCTVAAPLTNTTCSVPGTVTGSGTVTLTVSNSSSSSGPPISYWPRLPPATWLLLALGATLLMVYRRQAATGIFTLLVLICLVACDDSGSPASSAAVERRTAVTGLVTVTATSGIESHSATITVTVS